ncbi:nuclear transport factor 2 family protein [Thermodesulfobacteriota bacterium]
MSNGSLESRLESLENEVASLTEELGKKEKEIQELRDIEDIKKLQAAYAYYLENCMGQDVIDCFSNDPGVSGTFVEGTYRGPEGIRRYFGRMMEKAPSFLHQVRMDTPYITVVPDGKTAKGRWYGDGTVAFKPLNNQIDPMYMNVVYEMEYVKEGGIWKIFTLAFQMLYAFQPSKQKPSPEKPGKTVSDDEMDPENMKLSPDEWAEYDTQYPSGYIYPLHFKHPVTGKPTTENEYNAGLKLNPNPFKPQD